MIHWLEPRSDDNRTIDQHPVDYLKVDNGVTEDNVRRVTNYGVGPPTGEPKVTMQVVLLNSSGESPKLDLGLAIGCYQDPGVVAVLEGLYVFLNDAIHILNHLPGTRRMISQGFRSQTGHDMPEDGLAHVTVADKWSKEGEEDGRRVILTIPKFLVPA